MLSGWNRLGFVFVAIVLLGQILREWRRRGSAPRTLWCPRCKRDVVCNRETRKVREYLPSKYPGYYHPVSSRMVADFCLCCGKQIPPACPKCGRLDPLPYMLRVPRYRVGPDGNWKIPIEVYDEVVRAWDCQGCAEHYGARVVEEPHDPDWDNALKPIIEHVGAAD